MVFNCMLNGWYYWRLVNVGEGWSLSLVYLDKARMPSL